MKTFTEAFKIGKSFKQKRCYTFGEFEDLNNVKFEESELIENMWKIDCSDSMNETIRKFLWQKNIDIKKIENDLAHLTNYEISVQLLKGQYINIGLKIYFNDLGRIIIDDDKQIILIKLHNNITTDVEKNIIEILMYFLNSQ